MVTGSLEGSEWCFWCCWQDPSFSFNGIRKKRQQLALGLVSSGAVVILRPFSLRWLGPKLYWHQSEIKKTFFAQWPAYSLLYLCRYRVTTQKLMELFQMHFPWGLHSCSSMDITLSTFWSPFCGCVYVHQVLQIITQYDFNYLFVFDGVTLVCRSFKIHEKENMKMLFLQLLWWKNIIKKWEAGVQAKRDQIPDPIFIWGFAVL